MLTNCPWVPQAEKAAEDGRAGNGPCDMGRAVAEGKTTGATYQCRGFPNGN